MVLRNLSVNPLPVSMKTPDGVELQIEIPAWGSIELEPSRAIAAPAPEPAPDAAPVTVGAPIVGQALEDFPPTYQALAEHQAAERRDELEADLQALADQLQTQLGAGFEVFAALIPGDIIDAGPLGGVFDPASLASLSGVPIIDQLLGQVLGQVAGDFLADDDQFPEGVAVPFRPDPTRGRVLRFEHWGGVPAMRSPWVNRDGVPCAPGPSGRFDAEGRPFF